jgi:glycerol-3-phosphate dehydrogenase (NAD(P)+)
MRIGILGAGTWGTALGMALASNHHDVCIWSCFPAETEQLAATRRHPHLPESVIPESVGFTNDLESLSRGADFVLAVVPSVYMRNTVRDLVPYLASDTILVSAAKGIESDTLMTLTEVIRDELRKGRKHNRVCALSGPTHAEEVARNMPTLIVSASEDPEAAKSVQKLFEGTCIRPYVNRDEKGVQICGALKNVEALAVGIARGLGYGDNTCAAMMTRGMEEIRRLGLAMGCTEKTFFGLAGIGDLIVTATSRHSRNNRAGYLIGQGMKAEDAVKEIGMVVEGMNALPAAVALCEKFGMDMPLINAVRDIIRDGVKPADVVTQLMNRSLKAE